MYAAGMAACPRQAVHSCSGRPVCRQDPPLQPLELVQAISNRASNLDPFTETTDVPIGHALASTDSFAEMFAGACSMEEPR